MGRVGRRRVTVVPTGLPSPRGSRGSQFKEELCILNPEVHRAGNCCPFWGNV